MPLYEYRCADCRKLTTALVQRPLSDPPKLACSHCGGTELTRQISSFSFKGSWGKSVESAFNDQATSEESHGHSHGHGHDHSHGHSHPHGAP